MARSRSIARSASHNGSPPVDDELPRDREIEPQRERQQRDEQSDVAVAERVGQQRGQLARLRVDCGGQPHRGAFDPVAFVMRAERAQRGVGQHAVGLGAGQLLVDRGRDPPDQAMVQFGGKFGLAHPAGVEKPAPPSFGRHHRQRGARNVRVGTGGQPREQARRAVLVRRGDRAAYRRANPAGSARSIRASGRDRAAMPLAISRSSTGSPSLNQRLDRHPAAASDRAARRRKSPSTAATIAASVAGQRRARPVVEPGIVVNEEIVDRLRQSAIGATQRSRRAREQLTGAPAGAVVNVASVDRHGEAIASASLNCG